jgi:tetratricopeptide (TPR) repeat protein
MAQSGMGMHNASEETEMSRVEVTEQEIEAAQDLSAQREFRKSLVLFQEMLTRAKDGPIRGMVLFGIVTCSTWLGLDTIKEHAIQELKQFSDYDVSHAFVGMTQARAYVDFGRAQEALDLINENLDSEVLQRDDLRDWKYESLFLKGSSLVGLARSDEALCAFDAAHAINADGEFETNMLIERANCFIALDRYDEAFEAARQVLTRGDQEMATLAMQYMAECRMWQSRVPEALELYTALEKRLPCRLVQEERIQSGIKIAIAHLEKLHPQGKPF